MERAVAYGSKGSVVLREGQRRATGDKMTYTAADDNYTMTGKPVNLTEEKNGTCTLTVGTEVSFNRTADSGTVQGDGIFPSNTTTLKTCPPELKR